MTRERDCPLRYRGDASIPYKGEIELKDMFDTFAACGQWMEDSAPCDCDTTNGFAPFPLSSFPEDYAVAMAYIPYQQNADSYDAEKALSRGTLFPVLDKPFLGRAGCCI